MLAAIVAKMVGDFRSILHHVRACLVFAIERTQWIRVGATAALFTHLVFVVQNELTHRLAICRTTVVIAHGIDKQARFPHRHAHLLEETHEHDNHFGIGRGLRRAEALGADLVELTQAPLLGTLGAKHGASIEQLCRSGALLNEIMLNDGTHNARRAFGAKRKLLLRFQFGIVAFSKRALVVLAATHDEHFLAHHIGRFANAVRKHIGNLKKRRINGLVAIRAKQLCRRIDRRAPQARGGGKHVGSSLRCVVCHEISFVVQVFPEKRIVSPPCRTPYIPRDATAKEHASQLATYGRIAHGRFG